MKTNNNEFYKNANNLTLPIVSRYGKIIDAVYKLQNLDFENSLNSLKTFFDSVISDFSTLNSNFLKEFYYYARIANGWGRVLTMVYLCLLLIVVTFAGFSMMFYVCIINQGYLRIFMHILWNIIRFFIFSFFFYGGAYGMCYLALRDAVAYVMFVFGEKNLSPSSTSYLIPRNDGKNYLNFCLLNENSDYKYKINDILTTSLEDYFRNYKELIPLIEEYNNYYKDSSSYDDDQKNLLDEQNKMISLIKKRVDNVLCRVVNCNDFPEVSVRKGGLFGSFDCSFLKSDLAMMYRTLYDMSVEARILCALSCCIGFFGAIAVYFFLLVLHHYNNELFYDQDSSNFIWFDGNRKTKKKSSNKDPSHKKRKIRSEIELSSRNEEYSDFNKK